MNLPHPHKPLRAAALFILAGLLVAAATLLSPTHPLAFVAFLFGGGTLITAGLLLYLTSLAFGWLGEGKDE